MNWNGKPNTIVNNTESRDNFFSSSLSFSNYVSKKTSFHTSMSLTSLYSLFKNTKYIIEIQ